MALSADTENLISLCTRLADVLKDDECGLAMWHLARARLAAELYEALDAKVDQETRARVRAKP